MKYNLRPATQVDEESILGEESLYFQLGKAPEGKLIEDPLNENESDTFARSPLSRRPFVRMSEADRQLYDTESHSIVLKKWSGYIREIEHEEFTAVLIDAENENLSIEASFSINEVSEDDRDLVQEGALFDWIISRQRMIHGQIANNDVLVFKRFPMWEKSDLNKQSSIVDSFNDWLEPKTSDSGAAKLR